MSDRELDAPDGGGGGGGGETDDQPTDDGPAEGGSDGQQPADPPEAERAEPVDEGTADETTESDPEQSADEAAADVAEEAQEQSQSLGSRVADRLRSAARSIADAGDDRGQADLGDDMAGGSSKAPRDGKPPGSGGAPTAADQAERIGPGGGDGGGLDVDGTMIDADPADVGFGDTPARGQETVSNDPVGDATVPAGDFDFSADRQGQRSFGSAVRDPDDLPEQDLDVEVGNDETTPEPKDPVGDATEQLVDSVGNAEIDEDVAQRLSGGFLLDEGERDAAKARVSIPLPDKGGRDVAEARARIPLPDEAQPGQVTDRQRSFGSAELDPDGEGGVRRPPGPQRGIGESIEASLRRSATQEPADIDGVTPESVNDALARADDVYGDQVSDRAAAVGGLGGRGAARLPMTLNQVSPETGERLGEVAGRSAAEVVNPAAALQTGTDVVDTTAFVAGGVTEGPGEVADRAGVVAQEGVRAAGAVGVAAIENPAETAVQLGTGALIGSGTARGVQRIARRVSPPSTPSAEADPGPLRVGDRGITGGGGGMRRGARERREYEFPEQEEVEVEKQIESEGTEAVEESVSDAPGMHELRSRTQSSAGRARPIDADRRANPNAPTAEGRLPPREAFDSDERYQEALERRRQEIEQEQQEATEQDGIEAESTKASQSVREAAVVAGAVAPSPDPDAVGTSGISTVPRPEGGATESIDAAALVRGRVRNQTAGTALDASVDQRDSVEGQVVDGGTIPGTGQDLQTQPGTTTTQAVDLATPTVTPPASTGEGITDSVTDTPTRTPTTQTPGEVLPPREITDPENPVEQQDPTRNRPPRFEFSDDTDDEERRTGVAGTLTSFRNPIATGRQVAADLAETAEGIEGIDFALDADLDDDGGIL